MKRIRPQSFRECKSISDYLWMKYENPSYGGATMPLYDELKRDDDYSDYFPIKLRCGKTSKIHNLLCTSVVVKVHNVDTPEEKFEAWAIIQNKPLGEATGDDFKVVEIHSICISEFAGDQRTEYSEVECMFQGLDLTVFDNS